MLKKLLVFTLILGFGLVIAGLVMTDGDLTQIKAVLTYSEDYEQVTDSGEEVINAVDISLVDNDIRFYYSEDEGFSLDYYVSEKDNISHSINDGKLVLTSEYAKNRSWFQWRWHIKDPAKKKVNIYLPASFKGSMDIEITSGSLVLENFELSSLIMDFTSGNVDIKNTNVTSQIKSTILVTFH